MDGHPYWENDKLGEDSDFYSVDSATYEEFSIAEDSSEHVLKFLLSRVKDKVILDVGCGTGKFIDSRLVSTVSHYYGVELQESQLKFAQNKAKQFPNITLFNCSGDKIALEDNSVDVAFASWVIGSIHNLDLRKKVLQEVSRVLKPEGTIYLIENDKGEEFKEIIEPEVGDEKTQLKLDWLQDYGFHVETSFVTEFNFDTVDNAKKVFSKIWGDEIGNKVDNKVIKHNVVILKK